MVLLFMDVRKLLKNNKKEVKMTKIIGVVLGIVVGVLVIGSVLVPIVESSSEVVEPITEYNIGTKQTYREVRPGDVFKLTSTYDSGTGKKTDVWTLNGESILNSNQNDISWNLGIVSDAMWIEVFTSGNSASGNWRTLDTVNTHYFGSNATYPNVEWIVTFTPTTIDWTYSGDAVSTPAVQSLPYTWAYVPCSIEEGGYMASSQTANVTSIVKDMDDIIMCGSYTSGELDTGYYYYKGTTYVGTSGYTGENTTELTLKDGTYDLYVADASFTVTDGTTTEQFDPYRILVPYEVHGHADSGAAISLLELLPFLVIVSVLLLAVSIVVRSRY